MKTKKKASTRITAKKYRAAQIIHNFQYLVAEIVDRAVIFMEKAPDSFADEVHLMNTVVATLSDEFSEYKKTITIKQLARGKKK